MPFKFERIVKTPLGDKTRKVQDSYYNTLNKEYNLEDKGKMLTALGAREIILKARKEGFSSLVLALFAADDILQANPTETLVISYKDKATKTFVKRYRGFIYSYFRKRWGITDPKKIFSVDNGNELVLAHNGARFYCGTASARTAERGSTVHKLLFSEAAHYPDVELLTAREIIEGTLKQVDLHSGVVFVETTANGYGNHYEAMWSLAQKGESRFRPRFFGWQEFYTRDEYDLIASETTDKQLLKQEMPGTPEEAFISSGSSYFDNEKIFDYIKKASEPKFRGSIALVDKLPQFSEHSDGKLKVWEKPQTYKSYVIGGDTAEGIEGGDYQVLDVMDNQTLKTVAKFRARIPPDELVDVAEALGYWYNTAYEGIEVNKDGLWVNTELFKRGYPNLYFREAIDDITNRVSSKVGFRTDERTRPYILAELQRMLYNYPDIWTDKDFLEECLTFVRNKMGRPEAMSGKNDDHIFAKAIGMEVRRNAPKEFTRPEIKSQADLSVQMRLEKLYGRKSKGLVKQQDYI